jgi:hypothetical protein
VQISPIIADAGGLKTARAVVVYYDKAKTALGRLSDAPVLVQIRVQVLLQPLERVE